MNDMLAIWIFVGGFLCVALITAIIFSIILFFTNVYKHCTGKEKSTYTMIGIWKGLLGLVCIFIAIGIVLSICLFFGKVWEHVNQKPIPSISMVNCRVTEDMVYRQDEHGFMIDFTSNGKSEGLKIGDYKNE